jgi:hypothetical protein
MEKLPNFVKICQNLIKNLPPKQKEVIARRFGLEGAGVGRETLESIGQSFKITRERVRQIEADSLFKIQPKLKEHQDALRALVDYFKYLGDLKREDFLLSHFGGEKYQNQLYFILTLADNFTRFGESNDFYSFWTINPKSLKLAKAINNFLINQFKKIKQPLPFSKISEIYRRKFPKEKKRLSDQALLSFVEVSKWIEEGTDGLYGLKDWPEITPRGIKDKAYLVLKKLGKPLHFTGIASEIPQLNLLAEVNKAKIVLSQTVHNELIRDPRFVLVGRGIYALKEWGFVPGFVKDIIENVLRENNKPMKKEEVVREVLKQRLVKANTVLMSLHDKKYFLGDSEGKYSIKEI